MKMMTLNELAKKHGTDKAEHAHDYMKFYEELIGHLRDAPCKILEFGVKEGHSIRMWEEAFPKAEIVGVDKYPQRMTKPVSRSKIAVIDAADAASIQKLCEAHGPFDIVIDDSAHTTPVAQAIVDAVWPKWIKPGGWLVIEDVNSGYKRDLRPDQKHDFVGWAANMVRAVNHHGNLSKCGPNFWERSTEFDKAIERIVYVPGIMAMRRRP